MKRTPFHERTEALNRVVLWEHWVGYLAAVRYQHSATVEYYAVRDTVGVFDASPLFKYRIMGADARRLLAHLLTRDVRPLEVGRAQYTVWCDPRGFVLEDGLVLRIAEDEYRLTSARPNLRYLGAHAAGMDVAVSDVSETYGLLAVQGPRSHELLESVTSGTIDLPYFGVTAATIAGVEVMVSRTGYTGDLGYELWVPARQALIVWDSLFGAGRDLRTLPIGLEALDMARIDAGLLQIDVDFTPARFAWVASQRETPAELGLGWMVRGVGTDDRPFVGRDAIVHELETGTTRWITVGIMLDPDSYERAYGSRGLPPPKAGVLRRGSLGLYSDDLDQDPGAAYVGYVTSLSWSPILKRHVALAKLPLQLSAPGSGVFVELTVDHRPRYAAARVVQTPFFDPPRRVAETVGLPT